MSRVSTAASSATRDPTPSAIRCRISARSFGAVLRQPSKASRAAATAARASADPPRATSAMTCSSTGDTSSNNFPTQNPLQPHIGGPQGLDVFVAKLNPAGTALVYSTYLGGKGWDGYRSDDPAIINVIQSGPGIAVDSTGDAFITGSTTSINFPTTVGSFQPLTR